jgi:hypothetical protein
MKRTVEEEALVNARRMAIYLWDKHWKADAPDWKPLPDLLGILLQIDNMLTGLTRADQTM